MAVQLQVPFSDRTLEVSDESADFWRSVGYRDVRSGKETATAKKKPAKKAASKADNFNKGA